MEDLPLGQHDYQRIHPSFQGLVEAVFPFAQHDEAKDTLVDHVSRNAKPERREREHADPDWNKAEDFAGWDHILYVSWGVKLSDKRARV